MRKPGPKPKQLRDLRIVGIKSFYTFEEISRVDANRGNHKRADFQRAATLQEELAPPVSSKLATTFSESARWKSCITQINSIALNLNQIGLVNGELAAAQYLQKQLSEVSDLLDQFRAALIDAVPTRAGPRRT